MKIGVSSYSFNRLVTSGEMEQIDVIGAAKTIGFDAIEFSTIHVPEGRTLAEFAAELRDEAERVGIDIVNYTIGADFLQGSNGESRASRRQAYRCPMLNGIVQGQRAPTSGPRAS